MICSEPGCGNEGIHIILDPNDKDNRTVVCEEHYDLLRAKGEIINIF